MAIEGKTLRKGGFKTAEGKCHEKRQQTVQDQSVSQSIHSHLTQLNNFHLKVQKSYFECPVQDFTGINVVAEK